MRHRAPLSPSQSGTFAMGRALIVFEAWSRRTEQPLDFERASLVDFALQHPQPIPAIVPEVEPVIRAHALYRQDLGGLFARRHYGSIRERFTLTVSDLMARGLLDPSTVDGLDDTESYRVTKLGLDVAAQFTTGLSIGLRALAGVLTDTWSRKNVRDLAKQIRDALPDESELIATLGEPFAEWLEETERE